MRGIAYSEPIEGVRFFALFIKNGYNEAIRDKCSLWANKT